MTKKEYIARAMLWFPPTMHDDLDTMWEGYYGQVILRADYLEAKSVFGETEESSNQGKKGEPDV